MYYYMHFIIAKSIHQLLIKWFPNIFITSYMFVLLFKHFTAMNIASLDICSIQPIQLLDNFFKLSNILPSLTHCYLIINQAKQSETDYKLRGNESELRMIKYTIRGSTIRIHSLYVIYIYSQLYYFTYFTDIYIITSI